MGSSILITSTNPFPGSEETTDTFAEGTRLKFQVTVDAVRRHKGGSRKSVKDHELSLWFSERMQGRGFAIEGVPRVQDITDIVFDKDGGRVSFHAVTFYGILTVEDEGIFRKTINEGLSRGKAYGLGLLLTQPV